MGLGPGQPRVKVHILPSIHTPSLSGREVTCTVFFCPPKRPLEQPRLRSDSNEKSKKGEDPKVKYYYFGFRYKERCRQRFGFE